MTYKMLKDFFSVLNGNKIDYCLLRNYEKLPGERNGDLDVLVLDNQSNIVIELLKEIASNNNWVLFNSLEMSGTIAFYFIKYENEIIHTIHIDIITKFMWHGIIYYEPEKVLSYKIKYKNFFIPNQFDKYILIILKELLFLKKISNKYIYILYDDYFKKELKKSVIPYIKELYYLLPPEKKTKYVRFRLYNSIIIYNIINFRSSTIKNIFNYSKRILKRVFKPKGKFIVITGPDGVGKSTISKILLNIFEEISRGAVYFHWLPPLFKSFGEPDINSLKKINNNFFGNNYFINVISLIRLFKNFIILNLAYLIKIIPLKIKGNFIIGDRYIYNYLLDPKSLNYYSSEKFINIFFHLIPKPDILFILKASPLIIKNRKQELDFNEIERQYSILINNKLLNNNNKIIIENSDSINKAAYEIILNIKEIVNL